MPDNRTEINNEAKIQQILVKAYPTNSYAYSAEIASDNIDDYGTHNPNSKLFVEEAALWKDSQETDNDYTYSIWAGSYEAIAHANEALAAIEKLGNPASLAAAKGEALVVRAYNHFVLVNMFAPHYNKATATTDLGIPYMQEPETTLDPKYERGTVAQVYANIAKDLEEGLPLVNDSFYVQPKFHFNQQAAYAFAARFYLFYEQYEKAIEAANKVLGANPAGMLRDWAALQTLPRDTDVLGKAYTKDDVKANLLIALPNSSRSLYFGALYRSLSRFAHGRRLSRETYEANKPAGGVPAYRAQAATANNHDKYYVYKYVYGFEMTNLVAQTGYTHTVEVPLTTDEALLVRAEALALLGRTTEALADLNIWVGNFYKDATALTLDSVNNFYNAIAFSTAEKPTQKKEFHPLHDVSKAEPNLLQAIIDYRRTLTLHEGLRWFDIRRYGIEVVRYQHQVDGSFKPIAELKKDDLRRTFQIPDRVIVAGLRPNLR